MVVTRTRRLINPQRTRRKLSPKQIKIFGTKAQKAALKRSRSKARSAAPRRKTVTSRPRRRAANPATLLTIGALNPQRSNTMATKRKRRRTTKAAAGTTHRRRRRAVHAAVNPHRRRRVNSRKRRNGTKIYVMRRNRGARRNGARRNPDVLGFTGVNAGKAILAGLVGVYATKTLTPMVASAVPQVGSSAIMGAIISGVVAWGGGLLVAKWDRTAGAGFMFGGLMQAGSQLLNLVVAPNPLSLNGLGDFAPAMFAVPENPIRRAAMQRAQAAIPAPAGNLSGMGAAASFV